MVFSLFIFYVGRGGVVSCFLFINIYAFGLVGVCFLGGVLLLSSGILVGVSAPLGVRYCRVMLGFSVFLFFFSPTRCCHCIALGLLYYVVLLPPELGVIHGGSVVRVTCYVDGTPCSVFQYRT